MGMRLWSSMPPLHSHIFPPPPSQVILAVGGMGRREPTSSIEQYDPRQRQWYTLSPMGTSRWGAGVSTLENLVFVVGGSNESSRLNSVECYDVATDQWSALPEMSVARNGVGVVTTGGVCVCASNSTSLFLTLSNKKHHF